MLAAVGGAVFTLGYMVRGGGLVQDDLGWAAYARYEGISGFQRNITHRPFEGLYHWVTFELFGEFAVAHLLLLAVLNGLVAWLLWRVARSHLPVHYAALVTALWVVLPNRSATRYWIASAPVMLGTALLLLAFTVAMSDRPSAQRLPATLALVFASMITYEGTVLLNIAVVGVLAWRELDVQRRVGVAAAGLGVVGTTAAWSLLKSNRTGEGDMIEAFDRIMPTQFGVGLLPKEVAALGPLLVLLLVWAGFSVWVNRRETPIEERLIIVGFVVWGLGLGPFLATGFPLGTEGVNDRSNVLAGFGIALVLCGGIGLLLRYTAPLGWALAAVAVCVCAVNAWTDMDPYLAAVEDGKEFARRIQADPPAPGDIVVPDPPNRGGVTYAHADAELRAAVSLAHPEGISPFEFEDVQRTDW